MSAVIEPSALMSRAFMSDLHDEIEMLEMLSKAISAGACRFNFPPVNLLVRNLRDANIIPPDLAGELLDAIPLLSRAAAGKSEFYEEAAEWVTSRGLGTLVGLKEVYRRAIFH